LNLMEATQKWVGEFNSIPASVIEKLIKQNEDDFYNITPHFDGEDVTVYKNGSIVEGTIVKDLGRGSYLVKLDDEEEPGEFDSGDLNTDKDQFPMWGTLWSFGSWLDTEWVKTHEGLEALAKCGFMVFESEDYEYVFGINGAGYDFYTSHWIPLYLARGIKWHKEPITEEYLKKLGVERLSVFRESEKFCG